jgi:hypothetical protein
MEPEMDVTYRSSRWGISSTFILFSRMTSCRVSTDGPRQEEEEEERDSHTLHGRE